MENTSRLYETLIQVLGQHRNWLDVRHFKTMAWMMVGLIQSECVNLSKWVCFVQSRATRAASVVRRFRRWLDNDHIHVNELYAPLIQQALQEWGNQIIYIALDTTLLWNTYCVVRLSLIYRGRAIPIVWKVLEHASAQVGYED